MEWILICLILIGVLVFLTKSGSKNIKHTGYSLTSNFLSPAERSFYGVLLQVVSENHVVFCKVRIADVLKPEKGLDKSKWQSAFNKIALKHFDFVLCNKNDLKVIAALELDDKSHVTKQSQARDSFIEEACTTANLKLIRFKAKKAYKLEDVRQHLVFSSSEDDKS